MGHCVAKIQRGSRLVVVSEAVYEYRWVEATGGHPRRRVIVLTRRPLTVGCDAPCVVTAQGTDGKRVAIRRLRRRPVTIRRGDRLVSVVRRVPAYTFAACPSANELRKAATAPGTTPVARLPQLTYPVGTLVTMTVNDGSFLTLDFDQFQRSVPLTGTMTGIVTGADGGSRVRLTTAHLILAPTGFFATALAAAGSRT